jgi:hypothetical protein
MESTKRSFCCFYWRLQRFIVIRSYIKATSSFHFNFHPLSANNNINQIGQLKFENFPVLEILDLSINHISNWYERVFLQNEDLKIMNLRNNNINLLTPEMMADFNQLRFLAIGGNSFVCDCMLRDFIERAVFNARMHQCKSNRRSKRSLDFTTELPDDPKYHYNVLMRKYHSYGSYVDESCKNIIGNSEEKVARRKIYEQVTEAPSANCDLIMEDEMQNNTLTFEFLLLDYNENDYHCIESDGLSKRKVLFNDINACIDNNRRSSDSPMNTTLPYESGGDDVEVEAIEDIPNTPSTLLVIYISVGIPLTFIVALWFWKRKDIRYFCTIFKNTLILSLDKEDKKALMMTNRRRKSNNQEDSYTYDVFVSYCDRDREWVLDHLIPNIEKRSEVTICLHERDFQVGLSILENISQCMDQSRCLLLVISESFLKSNWCSFEMHLAQHR